MLASVFGEPALRVQWQNRQCREALKTVWLPGVGRR
jgi:hypothetical protein